MKTPAIGANMVAALLQMGEQRHGSEGFHVFVELSTGRRLIGALHPPSFEWVQLDVLATADERPRTPPRKTQEIWEWHEQPQLTLIALNQIARIALVD